MNRGFSTLLVAMIAAIVVVAAGGAWYYLRTAPSRTVAPAELSPTSLASGQAYVLTTKSGYPGPEVASFSIWDADGKVLKTIPAPGDLIYARTITVLGGKICYRSYRSESDQDASVAVIDPQTGQSKILKFTQTNNASENYQWTVSDDNSKIAWMNTEDKITVANIDGSDLQTYNTGISEIAGGSYINMRLIGNYVYFDGEPDSNGIVDLKRINLSDGSVDTVVNDMWPGGHAISNSGKYVVYTSYTSMVARSPVAIIKNLQTNTEYTIPSGAGFAAADFRPDESGVVLLFEGPDHSPAMAIDLSNGQATGTLEIVGFVSNSRVVVDSESGSGLMIMDLDGKNATKLGDLGDDFEGILILR